MAAMLVGAALIATIAPRLGNDGGRAGGIPQPHVPGPTTAPPVVRVPTEMDLLPLIDPELDATPDAAERNPQGIRLTRGAAGARSFLVFPYEPPDEYDLIIEFMRTDGHDGLDHCIVHRDKAFIWTLGGLAGTDVSCFWRIGNAPPFQEGAPTVERRKGGWFTDGEMHKSEVRVRNTSVSAYVDDNLVSSYTTTTGYQEVRLPTDSDEYPDSWGRRLGISILNSDFVIRSVKVIERSGAGAVHRHRGNDPHLIWAGRVGKPRPYAVRFINDGAVLVLHVSPHQDRHLCSIWDRDGNRAMAFDVCWAAASFDGRRLARAWDGGGLNLTDIGDNNGKNIGMTSQGVLAAFSPDGGIIHVLHADPSIGR